MPELNPVHVQKFLKGIDYPASKQTLLKKAKEMGADAEVRASLEKIPDREYEAPVDVSQALARQH